MKLKLVLIVSIFSGLFAIFFIKKHIDDQNEKINQTYMPQRVVVAGRTLNSGEMLSFEDIAAREFPSHFITEGMISEDNAEFIEGLTLNTTVNSGEVILKNQLNIEEHYDLLGKIIDNNQRLIPVKISSLEVLPEQYKDREMVDVLLTFTKKNNISYTKTILQNIEMRKIINLNESSSQMEEVPGKYSYFLVMSPIESEIYTHAQSRGRISFVIRNPADKIRNTLPAVNDANFMSGEKNIMRKKNSSIEIIKSTIIY